MTVQRNHEGQRLGRHKRDFKKKPPLNDLMTKIVLKELTKQRGKRTVEGGKPVHEDIAVSGEGFLAEKARIEEVMGPDVILRELVEEAALGPPAISRGDAAGSPGRGESVRIDVGEGDGGGGAGVRTGEEPRFKIRAPSHQRLA